MDDEIKAMFIKLLEGQNRVETEVKKNSIKLESIESNIDVMKDLLGRNQIDIEILKRRPV